MRKSLIVERNMTAEIENVDDFSSENPGGIS
jgi:hypothetical protein